MGELRNHDQEIWRAAERIIGRLEVEIEYTARARAWEPLELAARVARILSSEGQRSNDSMPVWIQTPAGGAATSALEGGIKSHGGGAQHSANGATGKAQADQTRVIKRRKQWSPERRKRQAARMKQLNAERWGTKGKKAAKPKKRVLTPEGRKAISDAVKRRWANQKKAA